MANPFTLSPSPELPDEVCHQAAQWLVELQADKVSPSVEIRWRAWRAASPLHEQAWQQVESCLRSLNLLPPHVAASTLATPAAAGRRRALKTMALLLLATGSGAVALQTPVGRRWNADYQTATAQRQTLHLDDGTQITLNAHSALNVTYNETQRLLQLLDGEILIESATDAARMPPLEVLTQQGMLRTDYARFSVRQLQGRTLACVFQGAVEVCPTQTPGQTTWLHGGEQAYFSAIGMQPPQSMPLEAPGWLQDMLVADDMRLGDFLDMLAAYHPGGLSYSPLVGELRISGTYPLTNTHAALQAVASLLPIQIRQYAGVWTRISLQQA